MSYQGNSNQQRVLAFNRQNGSYIHCKETFVSTVIFLRSYIVTIISKDGLPHYLHYFKSSRSCTSTNHTYVTLIHQHKHYTFNPAHCLRYLTKAPQDGTEAII